MRFAFPFNPLIKVHGIGQFQLLSLEPEVQALPLADQLRPREPAAGLRHHHARRASSSDLTDEHGLFKTLGWMIDTWSITDGTIDEQIFLDDVKQTVDKDKEILDRRSWRRTTGTCWSTTSSSPTACST